MSSRLNPKLTQRAQASKMQTLALSSSQSASTHTKSHEESQGTSRSGDTDLSSASETTSSSSTTDTETASTPSTIQVGQNPRFHLLHNGKWIPKEYVLGRWKPGTGLWNCCGFPEHLSMYCESLEQREVFQAGVAREAAAAKAEHELRYARKDAMQKHVQWSKEHELPDPNLKKKQVIPSYNIHSSITEAETQAKIDLATSAEHSYNAPMLVSWLLRHCQEEETVIQGLNQAYKHLQTAEGCLLLARHDLHNTVYRIARHFLTWQPDIVHLCLQCLRQLVDCNATRDMVLAPVLGEDDQPPPNANNNNNNNNTGNSPIPIGNSVGGGGGASVTLGSLSLTDNNNSSVNSARSHLTPPNANLDSPTVRCTMLVCEILMRYGRLSAEQIILQHQHNLKYPSHKHHHSNPVNQEHETEEAEELRKKQEKKIQNHLFQGKQSMTMTPVDSKGTILDHAVRCLMQASRYEAHRQVLLDVQIYQYTKSFVMMCYKQAGPDLIHAFLRFLHWSATDIDRIHFFYHQLHCFPILMKCFKHYSTSSLVLIPALTLCHWLVSQYPVAFQAALEAEVIACAVKSLKYVHDDEITQLTTLKLIQLLAKTSQGFMQLENIRGAWQELTQGTIIGEELVHQLPGPLQNKGWAIAEAPFRPLREIQGEQSRTFAQTALQQAPTTTWTSNSLRQFMGLSMSGQKLAINTEESVVFFELLTTLDMLPNASIGETKEEWFQRLRKYEMESELSIQEMVETVQEMRRREKIRLQMQKQGLVVGMEGLATAALGNFTAKGLYVQGKLVTAQSLQENDADIQDAMNGDVLR